MSLTCRRRLSSCFLGGWETVGYQVLSFKSITLSNLLEIDQPSHHSMICHDTVSQDTGAGFEDPLLFVSDTRPCTDRQHKVQFILYERTSEWKTARIYRFSRSTRRYRPPLHKEPDRVIGHCK